MDGRPQTASNIQGIADIIDEIKERPLRDARDLVHSLSSQRQFVLKSNSVLSQSTSPVNDGGVFINHNINRSYGSPNTQWEIPRAPMHRFPRPRIFIHEESRSSAESHIPVGSEQVPHGTARGERTLSHGPHDRIVVKSERTASRASGDIIHDDLHAPTTPGSIYQPMPPFNTSDLQGRSRQRHRSQSKSPSETKG